MITGTSEHCIGILILDTAFERIPGDAGNATTWNFPVRYRTVRDASALRVIDGQAEGLLDAFIEAGHELIRDGCSAISTTCGFLALYQEQLAEALPVPVATSSLLQVPVARRLLGRGRKVGVLTMDASRLTPRHLASVGINESIPMEGLPRDGVFWKMIAENAPIDPQALQAEVLEAGERLLSREPQVAALVLECANMPPYAAALAARLQVPVFDIVTMVDWLAAGLGPRRYPWGA